MRTAVIIDVIVAAVLLGFAAGGAHRGLFRSLAGLLIVAAALIGAGYAADALTAPAAKYLQPVIEKRVEKRVDAALSDGDGGASSSGASQPVMPELNTDGTQADGSQDTDQVPDGLLAKLEAGRLLKSIGVDDSLTGSLAEEAQQKVKDTGVSIVSAVVESVAQTVLHVLIFAAAFFLILLLLKLAMHAVDLILELPGLHFLNRLGGAVLGIAEGVLVLFVLIWILRRLGVSFETETMQSTLLLRFFTENSPLDLLSFL